MTTLPNDFAQLRETEDGRAVVTFSLEKVGWDWPAPERVWHIEVVGHDVRHVVRDEADLVQVQGFYSDTDLALKVEAYVKVRESQLSDDHDMVHVGRGALFVREVAS